MSAPAERSHGRGALRTLGMLGAVALGGIAVFLVVVGHSQKQVQIGLLVGLWGVLLGAFTLFGPRRAALGPDGDLLASAGDQSTVRRREDELRLEVTVRQETERVLRDELSQLRGEIAGLRNDLVEKVNGQLRLERIETTRVISSDIDELQHEVRRLAVARGGAATALDGATFSPATVVESRVKNSAPLPYVYANPHMRDRSAPARPTPLARPAAAAASTPAATSIAAAARLPRPPAAPTPAIPFAPTPASAPAAALAPVRPPSAPLPSPPALPPSARPPSALRPSAPPAPGPEPALTAAPPASAEVPWPYPATPAPAAIPPPLPSAANLASPRRPAARSSPPESGLSEITGPRSYATPPFPAATFAPPGPFGPPRPLTPEPPRSPPPTAPEPGRFSASTPFESRPLAPEPARSLPPASGPLVPPAGAGPPSTPFVAGQSAASSPATPFTSAEPPRADSPLEELRASIAESPAPIPAPASTADPLEGLPRLSRFDYDWDEPGERRLPSLVWDYDHVEPTPRTPAASPHSRAPAPPLPRPAEPVSSPVRPPAPSYVGRRRSSGNPEMRYPPAGGAGYGADATTNGGHSDPSRPASYSASFNGTHGSSNGSRANGNAAGSSGASGNDPGSYGANGHVAGSHDAVSYGANGNVVGSHGANGHAGGSHDAVSYGANGNVVGSRGGSANAASSNGHRLNGTHSNGVATSANADATSPPAMGGRRRRSEGEVDDVLARLLGQ